MKDIVTAKFQQHDDLAAKLIDTGNRKLLEANRMDSHFGIGVALRDVKSTQPDKYGKNVLGNILAEIRDQLKEIYSDNKMEDM